MEFVRLGTKCVDLEFAKDSYISESKIVLEKDGKFHFPQKKSGDWYIADTKIEFPFVECSPSDDFAAGYELGMYIVTALLSVYLLGTFRNLLR